MKSRKPLPWEAFAVEMTTLEAKMRAVGNDGSPSKPWRNVVRTALIALYRLCGECRTFEARAACQARYARILARYPNA